MSRIVPSELVVTDGESGFEKAYEKIWPDFRVRQCMFHAFSKAKEAAMRCSTLPASTELYALGKQVSFASPSFRTPGVGGGLQGG